MKRESKGQQVKTFKHNEPQPDQSLKEVVGKVYFDAKTGLFSVYVPAHIAAARGAFMEASELHRDAGASFLRDDRITAKRMDDVIDFYQGVRHRYAELMKAQQQTKVIHVRYVSALPWRQGNKEHREVYRKNERNRGWGTIPAPGLSMQYETLFESAGKVYKEIIHEAGGDRPASRHLEYKGAVKDFTLIQWTQEREDFFAAVCDKLEQLVMRIDIFMHDLPGNTDLAIADMRGILALPAPEAKK